MGGRIKLTKSYKLNEKKKGLTDWMNIIKPGNEEKDHWVIIASFLKAFTTFFVE